jgi:hypothetical protein
VTNNTNEEDKYNRIIFLELTMEDSVANCSPEKKKRTASKAFGPAVTAGDDKKEEEDDDFKKKCAGDKFVETVKTPTVEECVCYLERNKIIRQIIGLLIELEESHDQDDEDDDKAMSNMLQRKWCRRLTRKRTLIVTVWPRGMQLTVIVATMTLHVSILSESRYENFTRKKSFCIMARFDNVGC